MYYIVHFEGKNMSDSLINDLKKEKSRYRILSKIESGRARGSSYQELLKLMSRTALSKHLKYLVAKKLISKIGNPKKASGYLITPKGKEYYKNSQNILIEEQTISNPDYYHCYAVRASPRYEINSKKKEEISSYVKALRKVLGNQEYTIEITSEKNK